MLDLGTTEQDSSIRILMDFLDDDGEPTMPINISYRIDDVYSGTEMLPDTTINPAQQVVIIVDEVVNAMVDETRTSELRELTLYLTFGSGEEARKSYRWRIENLAFRAS